MYYIPYLSQYNPKFIFPFNSSIQDPTYKKVEPKKEIDAVERDKFWAIEEEEEKQRQIDEVRKKQEELLKLEQERLKREVSFSFILWY